MRDFLEVLTFISPDIKELEFECNICHDYVHYIRARHCYQCLIEYNPNAFSICFSCFLKHLPIGDKGALSLVFCPLHRALPSPPDYIPLSTAVDKWLDHDWHHSKDFIVLNHKQQAVFNMLYEQNHDDYETKQVVRYPPTNLPSEWFTLDYHFGPQTTP